MIHKLLEHKVEILGDNEISKFENVAAFEDEAIWYEEFLDYKIVLGSVKNIDEAI